MFIKCWAQGCETIVGEDERRGGGLVGLAGRSTGSVISSGSISRDAVEELLRAYEAPLRF